MEADIPVATAEGRWVFLSFNCFIVPLMPTAKTITKLFAKVYATLPSEILW